MFKPTLSTFLRDKRRELGWTQNRLCEAAGIYSGPGGSGNMISHLEQEVATPSREMAARLGDVLGCRQELLLLAGFLPDQPGDLNALEPELARSIRQALGTVSQTELAAKLRELVAS